MLVIDASVAVKFVTDEPGSNAAYAIVTGPEPLIAPDWVICECANVIGKKVLAKTLPRALAETCVSELPRFFSRLFDTNELIEKALRHSFDLEHAFYDCIYLALGLRENAVLLTADRKFASAAGRAGLGDHVRLLPGSHR